MKTKIDISYTSSAQEQLKVFQEQQVKKLEELIFDSKAYPGIDSIEITGSDVQNFTKYFVVRQPYRKKNNTALIVTLYVSLGIIITFIGLLYEDLIRIIQHNPVQLAYIATGVSLIIGGIMMMIVFSKRKKELEVIYKIEKREMLDKYMEQASIQNYEYDKQFEEYNRILTDLNNRINLLTDLNNRVNKDQHK